MKENRSQMVESGFCPVCRARFRQAAVCPRCGADLEKLMLIQAHAYIERQSARRSLIAGDARSALARAKSAQRLQATAEGKILETLCAVLAKCRQPPSE